MKLNLTLWMGIILIVIAGIRACGIPLNAFVVVGISISAVFISVHDLLEETRTKNINLISSVISGLVIAFILIPGLFPVADNQYENILKVAGDVATILGLGIVLVTVGIKNSRYISDMLQNFEKLTREKQEQANPKFQYETVRLMATQEYKMMLSINDIIQELVKRDHSVFDQGRVHDGWSLFYDTLEGFKLHGGPLYDLLLDQLFWEFAEHLNLNVATSYFATLSDSDTHRRLGMITMWGCDMQISSYRILLRHKGFDEGVTAVKEALRVWEQLKGSATRLHEKKRYT